MTYFSHCTTGKINKREERSLTLQDNRRLDTLSDSSIRCGVCLYVIPPPKGYKQHTSYPSLVAKKAHCASLYQAFSVGDCFHQSQSLQSNHQQKAWYRLHCASMYLPESSINHPQQPVIILIQVASSSYFTQSALHSLLPYPHFQSLSLKSDYH